MSKFNIGDRVIAVKDCEDNTYSPNIIFKKGAIGTVIDCDPEDGHRSVYVKFDRSPLVYGGIAQAKDWWAIEDEIELFTDSIVSTSKVYDYFKRKGL